MIEVTLDGYKYYYHKTEDKGYWLGLSGYKGSLSRTPHCAVPVSMWGALKEKAVAEGHEFAKEEAPKKVTSSKKKSSKKNSISIF